jgi:hypothetical protein
MKTSIVALALTFAFAIGTMEATAGWGRTRVPVAPAAPVVVTNYVVPATTYYVPAPRTTYYAPAARTTYYAPVPVMARPIVVAPTVVARPIVMPSQGYIIPPPAFRLRRDAPSLYVPAPGF